MTPAPPPPADARPGEVFPVVGVGASAGGLEAFSELLSNLPADVPMAIVLVQHLDPKHSSLLTELLTRTTPMPVVEVRPGARVEPAHVYVIPPNTTMTITAGMLELTPRVATHAPHMPIDTFFRSLAEDLGSRAIGVVLSGTASDGALGIKAIKGEGGVTFAQEPDTARYDGMPRSAIASGGTDFVLPPKGIAQELARIGRHPYVRDAIAPAVETPEPSAERALGEIYRLLQQESGVDFRLYRQTTIRRRIARRMLVHRLDTLERYRRHLEENRAEVQNLYNEVLINVTRFFRDPAVFEAVQHAVARRLNRHRGPDQALRVWVPGCATGEEAYSLAMVLIEALDKANSKLSLQVFGTDVSEAAVARARSGVYPSNIELDVSPERLRRFFTKTDGQYQVRKSVRELCIFARHNLAKDPPFSAMDVISCRNVLIYFDGATQRRIMSTFHYALRNSGILLLGASETVGPLAELFTLIDKQHKLHAKRSTSTRSTLGLTALDVGREERDRRPPAARPEDVLPRTDLQREIDRVLINRYVPASVLINEANEILQFRGHTGAYLEPAQGHASLNIMKMAREGLLMELRAALTTARKRNTPMRREGLRVKQESGETVTVNIEVIPVRGPAEESNYLVVFERRPVPRRPAAPPPRLTRRGAYQREIERLEQELTATKEFLQSIIEDREAANEELRSANEELQSANEELQSTNEELETAKEELQSVNEELTTVNEELQHRNSELNQANNDLNNLIASANIPIIILGNDLRIRRFTPMAARAFNLLPADIGRPISGIRGNVDVPDLEALCAEAVASVTPVAREVRDLEGGWHSLRIRPYRTADNQIDGAVLALIDISAVKQSLEQVAAARDYAEAVVNTVKTPLVLLDADLHVRSANRAFYETFRVTVEQTANRFLHDLGHGQWNIPALRRALVDVVERGAPFDDFEVEHDFPGIGPRTMLLSARMVRFDAEGPRTVLLAIDDITPRRQAERELRASEEVRYRRLFETASDGIAMLDADSGQITLANPHWTELTGLPPEGLLGRTLADIGVFEDVETVRAITRELQQRDVLRYADLRLHRADGAGRRVELACNVYRVGGRRVIQCIARDVTERMELLQRERTARAEAESANRAKDDFLSILSHELRTPLTAMLGWIRLLRTERLEASRTGEALETIERNTRLLGQLIEDLLDVSRIAAGKMAIEMRSVELAAVVRAAADMIGETAAVKDIAVALHLPDVSPVVRGDRRRLQQVAWNLLSNAVKFTSNGGRIDASLEAVSGTVRLTVTDTGRGIPRDMLPFIFDRFRQAETVASRTQGGLGLGLAIVRHLVELHGGRLHAFSAGEGQGATFTVELPETQPREAAASEERDEEGAAPPALDAPRIEGVRVLVVEDEADTARMLTQALRDRGADVIAAATVEAALAALEQNSVHVIVSDIALPGQDGYELLRRARARPPGVDVPAVALTAFARDEDAHRAIAAGFDVHIAKPIDPAEIVRTVARLTRAR